MKKTFKLINQSYAHNGPPPLACRHTLFCLLLNQGVIFPMQKQFDEQYLHQQPFIFHKLLIRLERYSIDQDYDPLEKLYEIHFIIFGHFSYFSCISYCFQVNT